jgi:hypothetical protein
MILKILAERVGDKIKVTISDHITDGEAPIVFQHGDW